MQKNSGMNYAFASTNDEPAIRQLLEACDLHHEDITTGHFGDFILAWDGPRLIAVSGLEIKQSSALLRSLAVDASYRNRGIATNLVGRLEDHARSMNVKTLYLLTMTAEAFFLKYGYRRVARESAPAGMQETSEFQNLCPASAACMVKHLA